MIRSKGGASVDRAKTQFQVRHDSSSCRCPHNVWCDDYVNCHTHEGIGHSSLGAGEQVIGPSFNFPLMDGSKGLCKDEDFEVMPEHCQPQAMGGTLKLTHMQKL
jgi:hypothetical protein